MPQPPFRLIPARKLLKVIRLPTIPENGQTKSFGVRHRPIVEPECLLITYA
jgi:hypothetical protein